MQRELGRLVEAELVYQQGAIPQATYVFKHALIQDTAYESLLRGTRQGYHRRIAEVLTERFPETVENQPELLAHHYTQSGLNEQAIGYWQQAGERAIQRSAHVEAISHLTRGLSLLHTLPETPERRQREIALQLSLGVALITTKGFSVPEVRQTYTHALELCNQIGETPELGSVLAGLWTFYFTRAEYQTAWELGEQLLSLARHTRDQAPFLPVANSALGVTCLMRGELLSACAYLEQGVSLYQHAQHDTTSIRAMGVDAGPMALGYYGWALAYRGYPDLARMRVTEALTLAQEVSHPYTLARTLNYSAYIYQDCRDWPMVQTQAETVITLATEQRFTLVAALGSMMYGWALAMQGQGMEGIAHLRQGLTAWELNGTEATHPLNLALLAEAYGTVGQLGDGLVVLAEALTLVDKTGEHFYEAELHRLRGELLFLESSENQTEAESCFHQAISIAQNQQAKSWELRAATSLARLWKFQRKHQEAYGLLAPVYHWFTEGHDTADLIDARALLDELGGQ